MATKLVHSQDAEQASAVWLTIECIESVHTASGRIETMVHGTQRQANGSVDDVIQVITGGLMTQQLKAFMLEVATKELNYPRAAKVKNARKILNSLAITQAVYLVRHGEKSLWSFSLDDANSYEEYLHKGCQRNSPIFVMEHLSGEDWTFHQISW